jgi:hypothetical protein
VHPEPAFLVLLVLVAEYSPVLQGSLRPHVTGLEIDAPAAELRVAFEDLRQLQPLPPTRSVII